MDEPTYIAKLSSNHNNNSYIEICGWSGLLPIRFINIWDDCKFLDLLNNGNIVPKAENSLKHCITLKEMEAYAKLKKEVVNHPIFVQVIAKRKIDLFVRYGKILIIPLVVIADKSGYCVLCCFNEGLPYVYNEVEVGDFLLITRCTPQVPLRTYHRDLFSSNMFIDMELKIQFHNVRVYYIKRFSPLKISDFKLSEELFTSELHVKLPNELESEFGSPDYVPPLSQIYYDVAGVLSYVGRIERANINQPLKAECLVDGAIQDKIITRYIVFRWVCLVDKTSRPVPVKLLVNNLTLPYQDILVPGALVVITKCTTAGDFWVPPHSCASAYSQIYVCGNIEKYYMLHPQTFKAKTGEILIRSNYIDIITRQDIPWSAGGTHSFKISSDYEFRKLFTRHFSYQIEDKFPLVRRETRRIYFEGLIWRVIEVYDEDHPTPIYLHKRYMEEKDKMTTDYKLLETFLPYVLYQNSSWYAFARRLPPYDPIILQGQQTRSMVSRIVSSYKKLCLPLLLPAELDNKQLPATADMDRLDGPPYFLLDIVNAATKNWYRCIWKSQKYSHEEMSAKINLAKDKKISCVADVFCLETDAPLEVNLMDFVTAELSKFNK